MTDQLVTPPADVGDKHCFRELVFSDVQRYRPAARPSWLVVARLSLTNPGLAATVLLRAQQRLHATGRKVPAMLLRTAASVIFGADFVPGMRVGPGLYLPHPAGVVIGGDLVIGADVTILQGVTAGARTADGSQGHDFATVGDGAVLASHAVLLGGLRVGFRAEVGANTVVARDVPDHAIVLGVPARRVGTRESAESGSPQPR